MGPTVERSEGDAQSRRTWVIFHAKLWVSFMLAFIPEHHKSASRCFFTIYNTPWPALGECVWPRTAIQDELLVITYIWRNSQASPAMNTRSFLWYAAATRWPTAKDRHLVKQRRWSFCFLTDINGPPFEFFREANLVRVQWFLRYLYRRQNKAQDLTRLCMKTYLKKFPSINLVLVNASIRDDIGFL